MQQKKQVILRVDPRELAVIKKAAKAERRSMTQYFIIAALQAAKSNQTPATA